MIVSFIAAKEFKILASNFFRAREIYNIVALCSVKKLAEMKSKETRRCVAYSFSY